jgi:hypothetical protein
VAAVGGADDTALAQAEQIILPHQARHAGSV